MSPDSMPSLSSAWLEYERSGKPRLILRKTQSRWDRDLEVRASRILASCDDPQVGAVLVINPQSQALGFSQRIRSESGTVAFEQLRATLRETHFENALALFLRALATS